MWSHIREILSAVSPRQRLLALTLLLTSATLIAVGPKMTAALRPSDETLRMEIRLQRERIRILALENDTLSRRALQQSGECTDALFRQSQDFKRKLRELGAAISAHEGHHRLIVYDTARLDTVQPHQNPALSRVNEMIRSLDKN